MIGGTRAVSPVLGYVLTLGISSMLVVGLLVGTGGFVSEQRHETMRDELEVIGQQIAADLSAADRLLRDGQPTDTVRVVRPLPNEVTGVSYQIEVDSGTPTTIRLTTKTPAITVEVDVRTTNTVDSSTLSGGDVAVVETGGNLEVQNG